MEHYPDLFSTVLQSLLLGILRHHLPISAFAETCVVGVLLMLSALFSGSEVAYFSLSPKQIAELKSNRASSSHGIIQLLGSPKKLLATLLILNNFVNIGIVILSSFVLRQVLDLTNHPGLDFLFEVIFVSFFMVMLGEVMPKVYATRKTTELAHFMAFPLLALNKLLTPLSGILLYSTSFIDKRAAKRGYDISADELSHAIDLTSDISAGGDENKILKGIVKFGSIDVKQIMKSRSDVIAFEYKTPFRELLDKIRESGYSRVPVFEGNFDKVSGILYIKDLLPHIEKDDSFKWQSLIRQPYFVPESKKISDLLREFQRMKNHMAIVIDEYGGSSGLVTLEDILEEIVGDISDEFDDDELNYSKLDDHNYIFEGKALLNDVCRILEVERSVFDAQGSEADTLAGIILEIAGKIPRKNDVVLFNTNPSFNFDFRFTLEAADRRRINRVKITLLPKQINPEQKKES